MNIMLTTMWLMIGTFISYMLARHFAPDAIMLWTSLGFTLSLIIRFVPTVLGDVIDAI